VDVGGLEDDGSGAGDEPVVILGAALAVDDRAGDGDARTDVR